MSDELFMQRALELARQIPRLRPSRRGGLILDNDSNDFKDGLMHQSLPSS
jgi:hypothetical protein